MGYSYTRNWRTGKLVLCCDVCGKGIGTTKKYDTCPYHCCPKVALCHECKKAHPEYFTKEKHKDCKEFMEWHTANANTEKQLLSEGKFVRCSALGVNGRVHVLFRNMQDEIIGYYMEKETYNSIPLMTPTTPEHYAKNGEITPAPKEYYREA